MTPQIAYLEISPRMTGKTTRLVKLANQLKAQDRTVIFVSYLAEELRREMPGVIVLADGEEPAPDVDLLDAIWFYDEFDWLKSTVIRVGGYYSTTAKRVRTLGAPVDEDDVLMKLLELNGLRFERHFWPFGLQQDDWFATARANHSSEDFRTMFLGEFLA
ncbi:hypothetical protein HDC30_000896 [Pseudomonas sp. JAI115]|uniref:hypothetical protein n=1 Tax=Pseudomonas sp. JAI115 TaxID=2723061 RepID=UPI00161BCD4D|nr:hypothetical protein [Pseudomonas sp. JAI115]MBB6153702.1 hypothetical protein [Pseudomonas sp. JAI115]